MPASPQQVKRVVIQENIPDRAVSGLAEFVEKYYLAPNLRSIVESSYRRTTAGSAGPVELSWSFKPDGKDRVPETASLSYLPVKLTISRKSVFLEFPSYDRSDNERIREYSRVADDIQTLVWTYFQNAKMSSLYFVVGGTQEKQHAEAPDHGSNTRRSILRRIFSGNTTNMFLSFMLLSFVLFFIIGVYTVFLLIVLQLAALIYSDKIVLSLGNVRPTAQRPLVTIVSVRSTPETLKSLSSKGRKILSDIRQELSGALATATIPISIGTSADMKAVVRDVLSEHGIQSSLNDIEIRTRNVYAIVEKVAAKFHKPVPKITMSNSIISNAAATGISSRRSSIMITAGSLEDLNDEELESVIGHEFGHVKGHDSVILFGVTSFEFLGRFFLWYPLLLRLGLFYFVLAFGAIFLVGKFLETRADTESAIELRHPGALASALSKIGFRQLYHEKYGPGAKLMDWFRFDPHPPIYFRIWRMREIAGREDSVKHTFLTSVRDCFVYFFKALFSL